MTGAQPDDRPCEPPLRVRHLFERAGWTFGRCVAVPHDVPAAHPAREILASFSGLTVTPDEVRGEECARADLAFSYYPDRSKSAPAWESLLRTRLVSIADVHHGHGELYVAADGRCFGASLVHDAFYFEGASISEAVERNLLGRRSRPMLRPEQSEIHLYGITYTRASPELYRYSTEELPRP